jgi:hypothetical protein
MWEEDDSVNSEIGSFSRTYWRAFVRYVIDEGMIRLPYDSRYGIWSILFTVSLVICLCHAFWFICTS